MGVRDQDSGIPPQIASVRAIARNHVGCVRAVNEDRVFVGTNVRCWAVADGMGGHGGGDIAAQAVVDELRAAAHISSGAPIDLAEVLQRANLSIRLTNAAHRQQAGTTVVAAAATSNSVRIIWVGDSRAYRVREGKVIQLTHDHSLVQELVDAGLLTAAEAVGHPKANVVTRALGVNPVIDLDQVETDFLVGDRILLCSDGLSRSLRSEDITPDVPIDQLAANLLDKALGRDGSDNISLILIEAA